jgi:hypothetical protein
MHTRGVPIGLAVTPTLALGAPQEFLVGYDEEVWR